ncbi:MAG: caspase domain-containing protein [Candidatus Tectimicrobiota bacterium]
MKTFLVLLLACGALGGQLAMAREPGRGLAMVAPAGEPRMALVIGNGAYKTAPLLNPLNDARAMAQVLREVGFQVIQKENAGHKDMLLALRAFGEALQQGGVGLFYYAGHGMQVQGKNYLIPVDAHIEGEEEVLYSSVDAQHVLAKMDAAGNRLNIVILDACRNNPFVRRVRSASHGLAPMDAPVGTLLAFSTAPGAVASDGKGQHGLYTQHLLGALKAPGARIEDVFKRVRTQVRHETAGKQIPWENTSLEGDFVFVPAPPAPPAPGGGAAPRSSGRVIAEIVAPHLQVGDTWSAQKVDLFSGSVLRRYTLTLQAVTPDEWQFARSVYSRSWNLLRLLEDGKISATWTPSRPNYAFPLRPGKAWSARGVLDNARMTSEHTVHFNVVRQERVLVPAGIFDTLRVEGMGTYQTVLKKGQRGTGAVTHRYWFSPEVGWVVAYEYEETNWKGVLHRKERDELLSYKRAR